jgi:lysophospholipase L1-like esterase
VDTLNDGIGGYTSVQWWNAKRSADFSGYDCAIINLGINDALQNVSASDTTTAINNIISALRSANNGIKIFIATIVPAYSDGTSQFDTVNATIKSIASNANCYLIDLSKYSHARKATVSEAGHLTAWGYYRLAKDYIAAISYIMSKNRSEFKFVQFIGTNYSYS